MRTDMEDQKVLSLTPLHARVIIERRGTPSEVGRIIIPAGCREMEPTEGTVLAVGEDCTKVKEGMQVFYGRYSGFQFERDGKKLIFCNEEDVLAIINTPLEGAKGEGNGG